MITHAVETESAPLRVPLAVWLFALGLATNMFSGFSSELGLPIGLDRVLLPGALLLALTDRRFAWWRTRTAHLAWMVLALIATLSAATIGHRTGTETLFTLLDRIYLPALLLAFAPYFLGTAARRELFLRVLTVMAGYLGLTTVFESAGLYSLLFPRYIADYREAVAGGHEVLRAGGPFLFGEANGMALAMCGFAAFLLASTTRGPWRVAALMVGPLALVASIATMTRSVWLGVVLGCVAVACTRWNWFRWLPVAALGGTLTLGLGAAVLPQFAADVESRASMSQSLYDRVTTNDAAVRIIGEHPLTGIGWEEFAQTGSDYARQSDALPLGATAIPVHNVFLGRAAELGIPGLAALVITVLAGPVTALLRPVRSDLVGWRLLLLGVFSVWLVVSMTSPNPYPLPTFLLWTITGFVLSAPMRTVSPKARSESSAATHIPAG